MTPLLALLVSLAFEGYRPDALTGVGVLLAVIGNTMMVWPNTPARVKPASAGTAAE